MIATFLAVHVAVGLAAAAPSADDARFATASIAAAVAESPRVDVITKEDLRQAINLESTRQQVGCTETSCLAEVAAAMGARLVIYGSVGTFDGAVAVELSAFDGETATSLGRSVLQGPTLKAVLVEAQQKARALREQALASLGGEGRLRVLVMDLELRNAAGTPPPEPAPLLGALGWSAVAVGGISAVALVVGMGADGVAVDTLTAADARDGDGTLLQSASEAARSYEVFGLARATAIGGYATAAVLGAVAVSLVVAEVVVE